MPAEDHQAIHIRSEAHRLSTSCGYEPMLFTREPGSLPPVFNGLLHVESVCGCGRLSVMFCTAGLSEGRLAERFPDVREQAAAVMFTLVSFRCTMQWKCS